MPRTYLRCACCAAHAVESPETRCALCRWDPRGVEGYDLDEARENVRSYGVFYRPTDPAFAVIRHPILGPNGEYAIDRVALRMRAYKEFHAFGAGRSERADLTTRLAALLATVQNSDELYRK